jgi:hypothetical protein
LPSAHAVSVREVDERDLCYVHVHEKEQNALPRPADAPVSGADMS